MQPWIAEFVPVNLPLPSTSYMYACNFQLYRSVACDNFLAAGWMAPSQAKSWPPIAPPWGRRRTQSSQDPQQIPTPNTSPQPRRSTSAVSPPTTPEHSASSADVAVQLQPPPTEHIRRRPTRLSSLIRRHHTEDGMHKASNAPKPQYVAYSPNPSSTPSRSAPSVVTSFPDADLPRSNPTVAQQYSAISPSIYGSPQSDPESTTTPYSRPTRDPWESAASSSVKPFQPMDPNLTWSPISYASPTTSQQPTTRAGTSRGFTSSSDPGTIQRSVSTTAVPVRRESETAADAFASPSDFALFAEATSSLSIGDVGTVPVVRRPVQARQITPTRLPATLPPVPQESISSLEPLYSSSFPQARAQSLPPRQSQPQVLTVRPSRTQFAAEALLGLENLEDGENPDDELPDYAQSQMEATARQRWEATQRARELDEAWRRGRTGRGL